jgi:hypothetical protein
MSAFVNDVALGGEHVFGPQLFVMNQRALPGAIQQVL